MAEEKENSDSLKKYLENVKKFFENIDNVEIKVSNNMISEIKALLENNIVQIVYVRKNIPTMAILTSNKVLIEKYLEIVKRKQVSKPASGIRNVFSRNIKTFNLVDCDSFSWPLKYRTAIISHETIVPDNSEKLNALISKIISYRKTI